MKNIAIVYSVMVFLAVTAYAGEVIDITGSSTDRPSVKAAGKTFKKQTEIKIEVRGGGSSAGIKSTGDGSADRGMVSRKLKSSELKEPQIHLIRMDGVAVIVNKDNPLKKITKQQVIDIYSGEITNWKELGIYDAPIVIGTKSDGRSHSTKELFEKHFSLKGKVSANVHVTGSNTEAIAYVSGTPAAIGYVSVGAAEGAAKKGMAVKLLDLDGVQATSRNVANGTYPLRRELTLITKGTPNKTAQKYIDYMLSPDGQEIIARKEFVQVQ